MALHSCFERWYLHGSGDLLFQRMNVSHFMSITMEREHAVDLLDAKQGHRIHGICPVLAKNSEFQVWPEDSRTSLSQHLAMAASDRVSDPTLA
jgi:hypothetical protein